MRLAVFNGCLNDVARAFQVTRIKVECCRDEHFVKARRVNPKNFFIELKRRHVYKVAIACTVVAWLLMQVASQIFRSSKFRIGPCVLWCASTIDSGGVEGAKQEVDLLDQAVTRDPAFIPALCKLATTYLYFVLAERRSY